jgi:hypothetical protein
MNFIKKIYKYYKRKRIKAFRLKLENAKSVANSFMFADIDFLEKAINDYMQYRAKIEKEKIRKRFRVFK